MKDLGKDKNIENVRTQKMKHHGKWIFMENEKCENGKFIVNGSSWKMGNSWLIEGHTKWKIVENAESKLIQNG